MSDLTVKPKGQGNEVAVREQAVPRFGERALSLMPADTSRVEKGRGHFEQMLAVVPAAIEGKESKKGYVGRTIDFVANAPAAATKAMEAGAKLWEAAEAKSVKAGAEATKELAEAGAVLADISKTVGLDKVAEKGANLVKTTISGGLYTKGKLKQEDLTKEKLLESDLLENLNSTFEKDTVKTKEKGSRGYLAGFLGLTARTFSPDEAVRKSLTDKLAKNTYAVRALDLLNQPRRSKVVEVLTKAQIDAKPNAADLRKFLGIAAGDNRDYQLLHMKSSDYFFVPANTKAEGKEIVFFQKEAPGVFSVFPLDGSTPPARPRNSVAENAVAWAWGEGNWATISDPVHGEERLRQQKGLENEMEELGKSSESLKDEMVAIEANLKAVSEKLKETKLPNGHKQALTEMQSHLAAELKVMTFDLGQKEIELTQIAQVLDLFKGNMMAADQIGQPAASSVVIEPVVEDEPQQPQARPSVSDLPPPVLDTDLPPPPPPVADLPPPVLDDFPLPPPLVETAPPAPSPPPAPTPPKMPAAPAPTSGRGALLDAIQKGKTLKKVEAGTFKPAAQGSIEEALRKKFGKAHPEGSESEDEDKEGQWD